MNNKELAQQLTLALNEIGEIPISFKHSISSYNAIVKILAVIAELSKDDMVPESKD
jgi:hypothetical protein